MDQQKQHGIASAVEALNRHIRSKEISDFRIDRLEGETLTLQEKTRHFTFRAEEDRLEFQKEQSGDFTYIKVSDGEKFLVKAE